jgi:sulfate permease, SulP family
MNWLNGLPAVAWLRTYRRQTLLSDLLAAVIVTIMLIPQSLAYALLAGLPPERGLYASILPLVAYTLFGSSRTLAVGPVAVLSLMTATAASQVATVGTAEYGQATLALALLSGVLLTLMGMLRLGWIANFLSHPVITGFISASSLVIAASQLRTILGIQSEGETFVSLMTGIVQHLGQTHGLTLLIGGGTIACLVWVRRSLQPLLQGFGLSAQAAALASKTGPVVAVVGAIALVSWLRLDQAGVKLVGVIPRGLPALSWPQVEPQTWLDLITPAFVISLVGYVESFSVAQTLAAKRRQRIDPDQELLGLGSANLAAAMSGGYPVTGSFARSVVNVDAGAETPLAGGLTAVGIALAALFLTPLLHNLPQATLAATIIVAVLSLIDLKTLRETWVYSKRDFAAMAATIVGTLEFGVEVGILLGVALSISLFLWRTSRPHWAIVGLVPGTQHFRNVKRYPVVTSETVLTIRVDESLYFANARFLENCIYDLVARQPQLKHVVLLCSAVNELDASALESLEAINQRLKDSGVCFHLSEVKGPVMDQLGRSPFLKHLTGQVFLSQFEAFTSLAGEGRELTVSSGPQAERP